LLSVKHSDALPVVLAAATPEAGPSAPPGATALTVQ
jgi:hypothetical protein